MKKRNPSRHTAPAIKDDSKDLKKKPTANDVPCWDSDGNIDIVTKRLKEMFVEMGQKSRIEMGQKPAERAVFRKQHGIAYGTFTINPDIDPAYKVGVFAGSSYECVARFSSDTGPTSPDLHSTLGLGLKLFGINGPTLIDDGNNADFIFQNIDRFFARDADQMCAFTTAGVIDKDYDTYIDQHPELKDILTAMTKVEASCLSAGYWSILPFDLGEANIVKYRLVPDNTDRGAPFNDNDYLSLDLQQRLRQGDSKFRFEIQLRTNPDTMPLDDAQAVWSEKESPYISIAELTFPKQDICAIGQPEFGNNLSFNIWRTLDANKPLGSVAEVRRTVYEASAEARQQANGQQFQEPNKINPDFEGNIYEDDDCIVTAGIYPPIGVMRVGNSDSEYFIGPLIDNPEPRLEESAYRDKTGALKRQAAQFRVYGFNAAGKAIKELTADNAEIKWTSHLANQKSSWYEFQIALDIPEAADAPPSMLRNINVADRDSLVIDGGSNSVSGRNKTKGNVFEGKFQGEKVYLGEMHTDEKGRLIMLGGRGKSENIHKQIAVTFANNEGWYDDISDGPVTAKVVYEGVELRVDPAWAICSPPDYAPMQKSVRTMWDLMRDVAVNAGLMARPARPSFTKDILPIFERMTNLQWVNAGFAAAFGWEGQFDYTTTEWKNRLNDPSSANIEMRRTISNNFRRYDVQGATASQLWPWLYGDAISVPSIGSPRQNATISSLQLSFLDQWVKGEFDADYVDLTGCPHIPPTPTIDELPIAEQPDMLTKAAMDFCLADAFHPGCEMTWPMRTSGMYSEPFRLKHALVIPPVNRQYYGPTMSSDVFTLAEGPLLGGQTAGGVTRWMAIPWQTDTASCRDGYTSEYDPYLPTFWPARVPNDVLDQERYKEAIDPNLSEETRKQAFAYRTAWLDNLPLDGKPATYTNQINSMVKYFDKLAVVQGRPGAPGDPNFPDQMQVGILPTGEHENELVLQALKELKELDVTSRAKRGGSIANTHLKSSVDWLGDKQILSKVDLRKSATEALNLLLEGDLKDDLASLPSVAKVLNLLTSKVKPNTTGFGVKDTSKPRIELGVTEKANRFERYKAKG
ncbi:MAG: hypothetical protein ACJASQ_002556 [Crocinitomicaceae bacterium]|jgi:hypothetical protein